MGSQAKRNSSFRFEIDNFSEKETAISSPVFVSGGCEWYLNVQPKGDDILGLFLYVANPESLGRRWKRKTSFQFLLLNQSDKELYRSPMTQHTRFCTKNPAWGFRETLPLRKLQEKGFLENEELIVEVYISSVEAVDGEAGDVSKKKETLDITGCQDYASQVTLVRKILAEHPEIAEEFKPKNQVVKTEYMNILRNACSRLSELAEVGFKLDWLKSKLGEVSLESKKADDAERSRVQQLEERVKNLELMESGYKMDCLKLKLDEVSLERKKSYDADGSRVQQLEERVKNLELMESGYKMDCLKTKLEEISLERKKSVDADWCRDQLLEQQRMENLELMENSWRLESLMSKLEEVSLENKNADADGSQVQQLEDRVKNLELMVSDLKTELDKEKAESSADGFLLVDELA